MARRTPQLIRHAWPTVLPLAMIIATEYKLRKRPLGQALSGSLDLTIIAELIVYALVAAYIVYYFARPPRIRRTEAVLFAMWAYTLITWVSSLYSIYAMQALARGVQLLVVAGVAQALASHATRADMHQLAQRFVALVSASVVFGVVVKFPPFSPIQAGRFTWLYVHPVIAGAILAIAFTLGVSYTVIHRPIAGLDLELWPRWLMGLMAGMTGVALIGTKTRGSIIAGVVAALVAIVITRPKARWAEVIITIGTLGTLIAFAGGSLIIEYLQRGEDARELATLSNRTVLWSLALTDFARRPLFGYGFTASRGLFYDEVRLGGAHNALINVVIDAGIIGVVAWFCFLVCTCQAVRRAYMRRDTRADATIIGAVLVCLIVNSLTTEGLGSGVSVSAIWLYLIAAWVVISRREVARRATRASPTTAAPLSKLSQIAHF